MILVLVIFIIILKVAIVLFCKDNLIHQISLTEIVTPGMLVIKKKNSKKNLYLAVNWLYHIKKDELKLEKMHNGTRSGLTYKIVLLLFAF